MTAAQFLEFLTSLALQSGIVILLTEGLTRFVRSARGQCRIWTTCYVLLLALALAGIALPHFRPANPWRNLTADEAAQWAVAELRIGRVIFIGWLAGVCVAIVLMALSGIRTARFLRSCRSLDNREAPATHRVRAALQKAAGPGAVDVRLMVDPYLSGPFCWQLHRPYIVLPEFLLTFTEAELRLVLRHELEHLRTGHPVQLFLQRLVESLYWFHPLVWRAARQSALTREFACDEAVVSCRSDLTCYLKLLLAVAERPPLNGIESGAVLAFRHRTSPIARRSRRLLSLAEGRWADGFRARSPMCLQALLAAVALAASIVGAPVDVLASSRTPWSPWPRWSARTLYLFSIPVRDYEPHENRLQLFELRELAREHRADSQ